MQHYLAYTYDAAGGVTRSVSYSNDLTQVLDGEGRRAKAVEVNTYTDEDNNQQSETATSYFIHSAALGGALLSELDGAGQKRRTLVYAGGSVLAWQVRPAQGQDYVRWEHRDPSNSSRLNEAKQQIKVHG